MSELYADDYDSLAGGRSPRPDGLRRIAGAALFVALIGGLGLWAYRLGTRDAAEVPIIRAMEGPARVQPDDPGGLRAAHQGLEVNAVLAGQPAPSPAADAPATVAPNALADEDAPQGELVVAAPAVTPGDALAEGEDLRMPLPDDGPAALSGEPTDSTPSIAIAAAVATVVAEQAEAAVDPEPAAEAGPRPMRRPSGLVRVAAAAPAATPAAAAVPASREAASGAPAAREVASVSSGTRLVQLGAFDSEGIARQAWNILAKRHADLLGSKSLYVERTTANARVFYRLRVAGFESADQTRQMCEALRARGVDCIPVTLQ